MARKTTGGAIRPFSASTSQSNKKGSGSTGKPTGAEAAEARRSKNNVDTSSAYTYIPALPKRHRTSAQTLSLSKDEAGPSSPPRRAGQASEANGKGKGKGRGRGDEDDEDDDEEEDMESRIRKIAMRIAEDDLGELEDDDESEVDSDEAWEDGGSDDDRWGDIFRDLDKGKSKKGKSKAKEVVRKPAKPLTVNLDESEDEAANSSKALKGEQSVSEDEEDEDEDEEDSEDEDDDEEEFAGFGNEDDQMSQGESDDEEDDEDDGAEISDPELPSDLSDEESDGDLDELDAFVDQIASEDKKRKTQLGGEEEADTSSKKKRRVLPVVPGPAVADGSGLGLRSDQKIDIASLIASHPSLASASALLPSATKGKTPTSVLKQGTLSAPLPTIVQDRLNREAAYEKTKEEGAKWATLMKRVKEAEHLSFPLQGAERGGVKSSGEMLADYKPSGEHESAVHALLARANLTEKGVKQVEDDALQGQDLSMEEIKARRDQLRVQRELMFREEAKSKRVSKIKSKTFRKLARRRAAKEGEEDLEAMDEEDAAEVRDKMERQRAKERATLRHGAKTGRWAREADGGGFDNDDKRRAKEEMLEMKEKLRRRIEGKGDEDDSDGSDEDSGEEEADETTIKARAFDQLDKLGQNTEPDAADKGLMQMAFMQKARERERQKVNEMEETTRRDIELFGDEEASAEEDEDEGKANMMTVNGNEGRMVFSGPVPGQSVKGKPTPVPTSAQVVDTAKQPTSSTAKAASAPTESSNPWLVASTSSGPSRKRNTVLNASSSNVDKATANLKKASTASKRAQNIDDDEVDIEVDGNVLLRKQSKKRSKADATDGDNSEDERDELMPNAGAFKQRDLVAEAFAGDNVVEDFAKEKQRIIDEDAPKTEDTSLTGWGAWGGKGVKKRKTNPKFLKTTAGIEASERKDAGKNNVIITEKKDKKARQFQVKDLPYPYTSIAQYEARFNNPLGAEWNSRSIHQKETMPRVTKKRGAIIEPVRRLF